MDSAILQDNASVLQAAMTGATTVVVEIAKAIPVTAAAVLAAAVLASKYNK
jgi:hypothetical protein